MRGSPGTWPVPEGSGMSLILAMPRPVAYIFPMCFWHFLYNSLDILYSLDFLHQIFTFSSLYIHFLCFGYKIQGTTPYFVCQTKVPKRVCRVSTWTHTENTKSIIILCTSSSFFDVTRCLGHLRNKPYIFLTTRGLGTDFLLKKKLMQNQVTSKLTKS